MRAKGFTPRQLHDAANENSLELRNFQTKGNYHHFSVIRKTARWQRRTRKFGTSGWRNVGNSACFHGYYAFVEHLFLNQENPQDGVVKSDRFGKIEYNGLDDFREKAEEMGETNIGSEYQPLIYRDACQCEEEPYCDYPHIEAVLKWLD